MAIVENLDMKNVLEKLENVVEIIEVPPITKIPHVPNYVKGIINVRSKVVPVIDIRLRFGKEEILAETAFQEQYFEIEIET